MEERNHFKTHYVQIKPSRCANSFMALVDFKTHYVQIKRLRYLVVRTVHAL